MLDDLAASIKAPITDSMLKKEGFTSSVPAFISSDSDPFKLFDRLAQGEGQDMPPHNLDASHSFYLGYEMAKALTAAALSKQYTQDESLDWGFF